MISPDFELPFSIKRTNNPVFLLIAFVYKIIFLLVIVAWAGHCLNAQNLVPNPDFETNTGCPVGIGLGGDLLCNPWQNGNAGTCDYMNACTSIPAVGVPNNLVGYQYPHSGVAYCGLFVKTVNNFMDYREYLRAPLTQSLLAGHAYQVQFYISLGNIMCAATHIGAYCSVGTPPYMGFLPINVVPQVDANMGFLNDTVGWTLIEGCFVAMGGENYITIGNFHDNASTPIDPLCTMPEQKSYYLVDDVSLVEIPLAGIDFNLGADVSACYEYTIDPGLSGVQYLWSDGSTGSTLTVTTSGLYMLTVYDACAGGSDAIVVTILDKPPVDINSDSITMCAGETYTVNLNSSLGNYEWNDGSNSTNYVISSTGIYSVTLDDGCDLTSDMIDVTVVEPPAQFFLSNDTVLCTGTEIEFNFDPSLGDFTWQDGNTASHYIIFQEGSYGLTISNMCGESFSEFEVSEITDPVINLGPPTDVLCNGDFIDISLDPDLGTYVWQDGSTDLNYHITNSGLYSVTVTNACGQGDDSLDILALSAPLFDLGDSLSACPGDTIILSVGSIMSNYAWQNGSVNDSFIVTSAGPYALTIENVCGSHSDSIVIEYGEILVPPALGPDINLCPGDHVILSAGNPGADIVWQDLSHADTLYVDAAGIYSVVVSNECFSYTDTVAVTIQTDAPVVSLPDQLTLCEGNTVILDPGISGVSYQWNDGSQNPTLLVSDPGTYSLTVSNTCGTDVDSVIVLDGGPLPFVSLGQDTSICPGNTFLLQPDYAEVDQWNWSDGSTNSFLTIADSGSINVIVSNSCGTVYDTFYIHFLDAIPLLDLGHDTSLCSGQSITLSVPFTNVSIDWSDGSVSSVLNVNNPGTVYATISNVCGTSSDTVIVSALPAIPSLDLGPDLPLCPGEVIVLSPGILDVNYQWHDGSSDTLFLADHDQVIALTISNACGTSTDSLNIFISTDGPDVELGQDIRTCVGEIVTINANISGVDYLWQDGSTGSSIITATSGTYYVEVTNSCGTDTDTIMVDIHGTAPVVDLGPDSLLCEGNTITLTSSPDAETLITWQDGTTAQNYVVSLPGTYSVVASNHCGMDSDTAIFSFQSLPSPFDLGPDQVLCPDDTLILSAPFTSDDLMWLDGSTSTTYKVSGEGTYGLTVNNGCGSTSDQIEISYDDRPIVFPVEDFFEVCPGDVILLDVTQSFPATYFWNTGATSSAISVTAPGEYSVEVKTGCQEDTHVIKVIPSEECKSVNEFFIPNVFSPNGDGVNDLFIIAWSNGLEVTSMEGSIFDRWGNLVFSSKEDPFKWDGNFGDQKVMPGVYVCKLKVEYLLNGNMTSELFVGDVTVIR
ncbi:MAG: gliding motility-associated C-terminal domain-containing protein [Saprospiraceae bacterium]